MHCSRPAACLMRSKKHSVHDTTTQEARPRIIEQCRAYPSCLKPSSMQWFDGWGLIFILLVLCHNTSWHTGRANQLRWPCQSLCRPDQRLDSGNHTLLALLDLLATFDAVDRAILLEHLLRSFGISGSILQWIQSYLTGRLYTVHHGGCKSLKHKLLCSIPQGLDVGPISVHSVHV